jgi:PhnB protein
MATVPYKPKAYHTVTPYVMVRGVEQLIEFTQKAFGATLLHKTKDESDRVFHAEIIIGDSPMMLSEGRAPEWPSQPASFYLYVPDCDLLYKQAMAAGATSIMEPADQFYGDRHGGVKDASGNSWWLATHIEDVSEEEIERRMRERAKPTA